MTTSQRSILIATLGGQPQVVTFALDELLARGEDIREVIVLYLAAEGGRVNQALEKLAAEFADDRYAGRACRLRPLALRDGVNRLPDIRTEAEATAAWDMLRDLIVNLKQQRYRLHVCVSGGRRMVALVMVSVAILNFGSTDHLWHMYTPEALQAQARDGAVMHLPPDSGFRLIDAPFVPLGQQFPMLKLLAQSPTPTTAQAVIDNMERARCQNVVEQLTPRQLDVLKAFAAGLTPQQVADHLSISFHTVNSHKKIIMGLCRNEWSDHQSPIRYHQLQTWFGSFFEF